MPRYWAARREGSPTDRPVFATMGHQFSSDHYSRFHDEQDCALFCEEVEKSTGQKCTPQSVEVD